MHTIEHEEYPMYFRTGRNGLNEGKQKTIPHVPIPQTGFAKDQLSTHVHSEYAAYDGTRIIILGPSQEVRQSLEVYMGLLKEEE